MICFQPQDNVALHHAALRLLADKLYEEDDEVPEDDEDATVEQTMQKRPILASIVNFSKEKLQDLIDYKPDPALTDADAIKDSAAQDDAAVQNAGADDDDDDDDDDLEADDDDDVATGDAVLDAKVCSSNATTLTRARVPNSRCLLLMAVALFRIEHLVARCSGRRCCSGASASTVGHLWTSTNCGASGDGEARFVSR